MPATEPESALYAPIKALLESQGYVVKGEVGPADMVACRGDEPPVIVELKRGFTLSLLHQATDRLRMTASVYLAVPEGRGARWRTSLKANTTLCRRLGLGLILVHRGIAQVALDPGPYAPRLDTARRGKLLREFARRDGDPVAGGLPTSAGRMTAYRQDALRLAAHLAAAGPSRGAAVAAATGVAKATRMMADNPYGWFERVAKGTYALTPRGSAALPPDTGRTDAQAGG